MTIVTVLDITCTTLTGFSLNLKASWGNPASLSLSLNENMLLILMGPQVLFCSVPFYFYSRLRTSTAGSSPPPGSFNFLYPLLSLFIPLPMSSLQRHFGVPTDLRPFICHSVLLMIHLMSFVRAMCPAHFHFALVTILDYVCHSGPLSNDGVTDSVF